MHLRPYSRFVAVAFAGAAAALINAAVLIPAFANGSESNTQFSGNLNGAVVFATNLGTGPALEGVQTQSNILTGVIYGAGTSTSKASIGVHGKAFGPGSKGVWGETTATSGAASTGVYGTSQNGNGVVGITYGTATAVLGEAGSSCTGSTFAVWGCTSGGVGVLGQSNTNWGVWAVNTSDTVPALEVWGGGISLVSGAPLIIAKTNHMGVTCNGAANSSGDVMSLDQDGNMRLCGTLTSKVLPLVTHRIAGGQEIGTYAAQASVPSVEDFGQSRLAGGAAYVRLDPAFAQTIDSRSNYLVFITPEGDANALYVTQKSVAGFAVRESKGGRSSLSFNFRIVAKPLDAHGGRLPLVSPPAWPRSVAPRISVRKTTIP